jgi:hypothetical protein
MLAKGTRAALQWLLRADYDHELQEGTRAASCYVAYTAENAAERSESGKVAELQEGTRAAHIADESPRLGVCKAETK